MHEKTLAVTAICGGENMTTNQDFYDNINSALTPEQAAQALALAEGDTAKPAETGSKPEAATDEGETSKVGDKDDSAQSKANDEDGITAENAVVLAKDGKHTIPYDRLEKARQGERHWREQAENAQYQLSELQAQAQARADAGQTQTKTDQLVAQAQAAMEDGVDAELFGDFSEEALKAGVSKLVDLKVEQRVQAEVSKALAPLLEKQQKEASSAHYDAIYGKHPDADSIAESAEFSDWVNKQPSVVRAAYQNLFDPKVGGTAEQIVEVFDAFKASNGVGSPKSAAPNQRSAAQTALANSKVAPPSSLSSIPGGRSAGSNTLDATADMGGAEMLAATSGMTPQQIEAWLNRRI